MSAEELQIRLLGPLEVLKGEEPLDLPPSRKARALLGYLAGTGRPHSRGALCDLLWPDSGDPRAGLRWALSKLRHVLESDGATRIVTSRDRVGFESAGGAVDLGRVETAVPGTPETASTDALDEAWRGFRGEFLEGLNLPGCHRYEAWCLGMRERARNLHVSVRAELTRRLRSDPEAALPHALARISLDPFTESAYVSAIDVLGDLGRIDRALELYEQCRRMLADRLDARPSDQLEAARRRLRTERRAAPAAESRISTAGVSPGVIELPPEPPPHAPSFEPPLIGRDGEMEALRERVRRAASGEPGARILVMGEPGIGKTRLLRELIREVRACDGWVLSGRVFETEEVRPYGPWADMLRELPPALLDSPAGRAVSGLVGRGGAGPATDGLTERTQLFDAVTGLLRVLAEARRPGLVALDDVQWLDASSAALLHYVARTLEATPLLIAMAAREGELEVRSAIGRVVRSPGDPGGLHRIVLSRLDPVQTGALVRAVDRAVDPEPVIAASEGNPLFALAMAASLREGAAGLPSSIEEEVRRRLEHLGPDTRSVVAWAAALGRAFDVPTLVRVGDRSAHEIIDAIDQLERRGILRAAGADRYDFSHSLLRQAAYGLPSEPARRAIHRAIALALDGVERDEGRSPGAVAHHARLGGLARLSAKACIEAAEASLWVFAFDEAAELVERGLDQLDGLPDQARASLEMGLLRIYTFGSMHDRRPGDVEERVRRATESARIAGRIDAVAVGHALLMDLQYQRGAFHEAGRSSVRSAEAGRGADVETAVRCLAETGACLLLLDQAPDDARRLATEAFALAGSHDVQMDVVALARALLHHHDGELEAARDAFREVVLLGRRAKDRWWECPALTRVAMVELDRADAPHALAASREAAGLAERLDDEAEAAFARALAAVAAVRLTVRMSAPAGSGAASEATEPDLREVDGAVAALRDLDSLWQVAHVQAYAAEIELEEGRPDAARDRAAEVFEAARTLDRPSLLALGRGLLAHCAAVDGDRAGVSRHLGAPEVVRPRHGLSHRSRRAIERVETIAPG